MRCPGSSWFLAGSGADGGDGKVERARPVFPVLCALARETPGETFRRERREPEGFGEAPREMRLEGGHRDPALARGVQIIRGEASAQQRPGSREALGERLR